MIIGNGLIAKAFKNFKHKKFCIFASGVSNSNENNLDSFEREFNLIDKIKNYDIKLIYFSTSSIETKNETPYIKHKIRIENYIKNNFKNYLIIRLPIIVGKSNNPHQLINYLKNKIINNEVIDVDFNLKRNIIDVNDLPKVVEYFNKKNIKEVTIYNKNDITIQKIVNTLINIYNKDYKLINLIKIEEKEILKEYDLKFLNKKPKKIILKYYK